VNFNDLMKTLNFFVVIIFCPC